MTEAHTKVICSPLMLYYGLFIPKEKYSAAFLNTNSLFGLLRVQQGDFHGLHRPVSSPRLLGGSAQWENRQETEDQEVMEKGTLLAPSLLGLLLMVDEFLPPGHSSYDEPFS